MDLKKGSEYCILNIFKVSFIKMYRLNFKKSNYYFYNTLDICIPGHLFSGYVFFSYLFFGYILFFR